MKELQEQYDIVSGRMPSLLKWLYGLLIVMVVLAMVASGFVYLDVVVKAKGIIKTIQERALVRPAVGGLIDSIFIKEGQFTCKGDRLAVLRNEQHPLQVQKLQSDFTRNQILLKDLYILTSIEKEPFPPPQLLKTGLYREQFEQFVQQYNASKILKAQSEKELGVAVKLMADRIISPAELDSKKSQYLLRAANLNFTVHQQLVLWNNEKQRLVQEVNGIQQEFIKLEAANKNSQLVAPVSGYIMGVKEHYIQSFLQPGEMFCMISPEDSLIAECIVGSESVGFLRPGQVVRIHVNAFNHNYFGVVNGIINSIDNDFTLINESPVFKIRCSIKEKSLFLKNGYAANLKKGMTISASFLITQRTIWQLFFDRLDHWFEPIVTV